jgi:hypothetical protein
MPPAPDDPPGNYAFQRLRQTWFTPRIKPKFKLQHDNKFHAFAPVSREVSKTF